MPTPTSRIFKTMTLYRWNKNNLWNRIGAVCFSAIAISTLVLPQACARQETTRADTSSTTEFTGAIERSFDQAQNGRVPSTQDYPDDMKATAIDPQDRTVPDSMEQVRLSFAPVVDQVTPAVVNVFTRREVRQRSVDPIFERFFGRSGAREQSSLGSGVIVSPDGVVITNNHVIENMTEIKIVLSDRREYEASLTFTDPQTDLAVLKIESDEPLPFLEFANSDLAEVGDVVLAIGNPFGVGQTVTSGIISALARTAVSISDYQFFIQTDAAINPGNSGGALVDVDGRLVGINTAIYSRSGGSNGIGFAIPSRLVQQVLRSANNGGVLTRPWLGASTSTVTSDLSRALRLDRPIGAIIDEVWPGGPADKAGVQSGDVITEIDGQTIFDAETVRFRIGVGNPGEVSTVRFLRNGKEKTAKIKLAVPPGDAEPETVRLDGNHPLYAVEVVTLSPRFNEANGLNPFQNGVLVQKLSRRTFAARRGLRRGHRIISVNGKTIDNVKTLRRELVRGGGSWVIEVDTGRDIVPWEISR